MPYSNTSFNDLPPESNFSTIPATSSSSTVASDGKIIHSDQRDIYEFLIGDNDDSTTSPIIADKCILKQPNLIQIEPPPQQPLPIASELISSSSSRRFDNNTEPTARRRPRNSNPPICSNCRTQESPAWRRDQSTHLLLCNKCGIYLRTNGKPRPVKSKPDIIPRTKRLINAKHPDEKERIDNKE
ncbi:hypothetical protein BDR26DRAFT_859542 [Obelidium mucronatum]|nr:hypothetical protein BDR26DRAFT_859542 [Obelidium mucronatum]